MDLGNFPAFEPDPFEDFESFLTFEPFVDLGNFPAFEPDPFEDFESFPAFEPFEDSFASEAFPGT